MFSAPPVRTTCASPSLISCAALMTAWKPEPQSLHTTTSSVSTRLSPRDGHLVELSPVDRKRRHIHGESRQVSNVPRQVRARGIRLENRSEELRQLTPSLVRALPAAAHPK